MNSQVKLSEIKIRPINKSQLDKPGKGTKCGRDLVKSAGKAGKEGKKSDAVLASYTCTMHPDVTSDKPGKCPKCGMDLVVKK